MRAIAAREAAFGPDRWPTVVLSNHDQPRHASRLASVRSTAADRDAIARAAAVLLLTLRGTPFLYYGEELGMGDVDIPPDESVDPPATRVGPDFPWWDRSRCRTPMPWTPGAGAGFTTGRPWLRLSAATRATRNVEVQRTDPGSVLSLLPPAHRPARGDPRRSRTARCGSSAGGELGVVAYTARDGPDQVVLVATQPRAATAISWRRPGRAGRAMAGASPCRRPHRTRRPRDSRPAGP